MIIKKKGNATHEFYQPYQNDDIKSIYWLDKLKIFIFKHDFEIRLVKKIILSNSHAYLSNQSRYAWMLKMQNVFIKTHLMT